MFFNNICPVMQVLLRNIHFRFFDSSQGVSCTAVPITDTPHYYLAQAVLSGEIEVMHEDGGGRDTVNNPHHSAFRSYEVHAAHENACVGECRDPISAVRQFQNWCRDFDDNACVEGCCFDIERGMYFLTDGVHRSAFLAARSLNGCIMVRSVANPQGWPGVRDIGRPAPPYENDELRCRR